MVAGGSTVRRRRAARVRWPRRAALASGLLVGLVAPVEAADSAVIIQYHRFEERPELSTSISVARFEDHIRELTSGAYAVLPLPEIVARLKDGRPLPERAVGISIDDAHRTVWSEAWPRLKAAGLPFTLFVVSGSVDQEQPEVMSWRQIRELAAGGVTLGGHTVSHPHMPEVDAEHNRREILDANARIEAETGQRPTLFAYPYGVAGLEHMGIAREAGVAAAFGQHSGVAHRGANFFYLPRFSFNEEYGDIARFRLAVNALPLPVADLTPADPLIRGDNPPPVGFTVAPRVLGLDRLACYASHEGRARVELLGAQRVEVRMAAPLPKGRTRLNCTLKEADDRWRWWGLQFYVPG